MDADVERWVGCAGVRDLLEPWAGHHDRAASHKVAGRKGQESLVRAVAEAEVVHMQDHGPLGRPAGAHAASRASVRL